MQQEMDRAMTALKKSEPAPYFISYSTAEQYGTIIAASNGAIFANISHHERAANISVRVGSRDLDNTHGEHRFNAVTVASLPLEDRPDAIARVLWLNTDRMYKKAAQTYLEVKTNTKVRAQEEDSSPDFSTEKPEIAVGNIVLPSAFDKKEWENRVRKYSAIFNKYPDIEHSSVILLVDNPIRYFVSS